ncbi:uncharacterized protein BYT42DRAFT_504904 [Radiomyces spectabilis]|uniref:uncharacterized protein n=1 Tax=Radiomyces spectabilis TaxID=64574 RepID=UPI00222094F7|nr:uncharacterized protein BYT42DRAFT_504904 [Radiomyces spectabilis]KAI8366637.1 hypothetical protein BYT42DRAFT_504904 [Radiomyces spectabilis]
MSKSLNKHKVSDGQLKRDQLIQKLNDYRHRCNQLDRYMSASQAPAAAHPDAQQHLLHPSSQYTRYPLHQPQLGEDEDVGETPLERSSLDILLEKAQFARNMGELNEEKNYIDHAVEYYSEAAECFLRAFKELDQDDPEKSDIREKFTWVVDKAEELKAAQKSSTRLSPTRARASSVSSAKLRSRSPSIGSIDTTHSITSPATEHSITSHRLSSTEIDVLKHTSNVNERIFLPWMDETDLKEKFSFTQNFIDPDGTLRLSDKQMANFGGWKRPAEFMRNPQLIKLISSTSIIQDVVTDCSFVASLCVAAAYERKFDKQLITSCIYPQNKQGKPCYNPNGKYVVKFIYNGIARKVFVDDLLPVSREGTLMCTFSTNAGELWPSIIEKAATSILNFHQPGNYVIILCSCLTGWIPEHIFIHDHHFNAEKIWNRILDGAKYGDVLVTIATGELTEAEAEELGLVPMHAYAVIADIKTVMNVRFMQVKNPWSHKRWQGPYSHLDTVRWTPELKEALNYDPFIAEQKDDGIFWINFDSVCSKFTSIHLNWNPELFTHRWVLHSMWPEDLGPKKDIYNLGYNPQFHLTVTVPDKKPAAVWLLLSKHIMVTEENTDYITLHVYNSTGKERIYYPGQPFKEGTYVNSPHILVRFNAPPGTSDCTIVVSQHEKARSLYFSLRAYSLAPFILSEIPMRYTITEKIKGQWTEQTAAGILLMLEAPKSLAVHLLLVEGGQRTSSVSVRDIVAESGAYRHGFCYCDISRLQIDPIPAEGAGMFKKVIRGEWIQGYSAMGCPSYGNYNKIEPVPSINVTIYEKDPSDLFGNEVATSGPYTNVAQGVATKEVVLNQNETGYIMVFATHKKDISGKYKATIYSDRPINIRNDH